MEGQVDGVEGLVSVEMDQGQAGGEVLQDQAEEAGEIQQREAVAEGEGGE